MLILLMLQIARAQDAPIEPLNALADESAEEVDPLTIADPLLSVERRVDFSPELLEVEVVEPLHETAVRVVSESLFMLPEHWRLDGVLVLLIGFFYEIRVRFGRLWDRYRDRIGRAVRHRLPDVVARFLGLRSRGERLSDLSASLERAPYSRKRDPEIDELRASLERIKGMIGGVASHTRYLHDVYAQHVDLDEEEVKVLAVLEAVIAEERN